MRTLCERGIRGRTPRTDTVSRLKPIDVSPVSHTHTYDYRLSGIASLSLLVRRKCSHNAPKALLALALLVLLHSSPHHRTQAPGAVRSFRFRTTTTRACSSWHAGPTLLAERCSAHNFIVRSVLCTLPH